MRRFALMATLVGTTLVTAPLGAQGWKGRGGNDNVPPGHRPPPGMCRIWIDGVPPGQQPAPTDCANAVRNRPANGRVIFGDDAGGRGKGKSKKFKGTSYDRRYDRDDDRDDDRDERYDRDRRRSADTCVDRNHNGRCDYAEGRTLPARTQPTTTRPSTNTGTTQAPRPSTSSGSGGWAADAIARARARQAGSGN